MRKFLIVLMIVAMASFLFAGCNGITPEPDEDEGLVLVGIAVEPETMDLIVGGSDTIDSVTACYEFRGYGVILDPDDCLFLTSNSKVATADVEGEVTAVGVGIANILVSYKDKTDTLVVTVSAVPAPKPMEIIADLPVFEVGVPEEFNIEVVANDDVGENSWAYFTLPEVADVHYWEVATVPLTD